MTSLMGDVLIEKQDVAWMLRWAARIPETQVQGIVTMWSLWGRADQRAPEGDWATWLMMAGRGFGKTRAGAEWVSKLAMQGDRDTRIALVGATLDDVRQVMVEGDSGLLSVALEGEAPQWRATIGELLWPSGARAFAYSGANPDGLRGPQHDYAWCDEIAKWASPQATWDNLQLGLRLGARPRALVTTTPRPIALLRQLQRAPSTVVTRGRTADNAHLPPGFIAGVTEAYGGTRLGRQELDGELLEDLQGALWTRDVLERARVRMLPALVRVVVGVDAPAGSLKGDGAGDSCGIVVAGLGADGKGYVIEDATVHGLPPEGWAQAVASAAVRHDADRVVAEANTGGRMVESVLRAADSGLPVTLVSATRAKSARAEPVSLLYAAGKVKHLGAFPDLEDQLCGLIEGGGYEGPGRSPDRADACVWALTDLMLRKRRLQPSVRPI